MQLHPTLVSIKYFQKSKRKKSPFEISLAHVSADHFFVPTVGYLCRDSLFDRVKYLGRIEIFVN